MPFTTRTPFGLLALALALPLLLAATSSAATKPPLDTTASFAILAGTAVTNVPTSAISGDVGLSPAPGSAYAGLTCLQVTGTVFATDATGDACYTVNPGLLTTAKQDLVEAFDDAAGQLATGDVTGVNLAGQVLLPGVYNSTGALLISGPTPLVFDGAGNADSVFIVRAAAGSDLTVAPTSTVQFRNGAQPCNVFWKVQSAFLQNSGFSFVGTIFALTQITLTANITVQGRLLARNADVALIQDTITRPASCVTQASIDAAAAAATQAAAAARAAADAADAATAAANAAAAAAAAAETAAAAKAATDAAAAAEAARVAAATAVKQAAAARVAASARRIVAARTAAIRAAAARAAAAKAAARAKAALARALVAKRAAARGSTSISGPALPPVNPSGFTG